MFVVPLLQVRHFFFYRLIIDLQTKEKRLKSLTFRFQSPTCQEKWDKLKKRSSIVGHFFQGNSSMGIFSVVVCSLLITTTARYLFFIVNTNIFWFFCFHPNGIGKPFWKKKVLLIMMMTWRWLPELFLLHWHWPTNVIIRNTNGLFSFSLLEYFRAWKPSVTTQELKRRLLASFLPVSSGDVIIFNRQTGELVRITPKNYRQFFVQCRFINWF